MLLASSSGCNSPNVTYWTTDYYAARSVRVISLFHLSRDSMNTILFYSSSSSTFASGCFVLNNRARWQETEASTRDTIHHWSSLLLQVLLIPIKSFVITMKSTKLYHIQAYGRVDMQVNLDQDSMDTCCVIVYQWDSGHGEIMMQVGNMQVRRRRVQPPQDMTEKQRQDGFYQVENICRVQEFHWGSDSQEGSPKLGKHCSQDLYYSMGTSGGLIK